MTDLKRCRVVSGILVLLLVIMISAGCTRMAKLVSSKGPKIEANKETEALGVLYYDFEDILVPLELKIDKKRSFIIHTPGFSAGVLVLTGQVETDSLVRFFKDNMAKDSWRILSFFKSSRTIMFFEKADRRCIINITKKNIETDIEIWLMPHTQEAHEG